MNTTPSTEERIWAVLSNLSALSLGMGILLPVVGWSDQRRKSNYASFQSLQALGYQSVGFTVWILLLLVILIFASVVLLVGLRPGDTNAQVPDPALQSSSIVFLILIFGLFALYLVLPVIAAIACAFGRDFRYPILGDRLARYLEYDSAQKPEEQAWLNEDHEFRWVASMGHFSILILIWGMLAPLTAWMLQGKNNRFVKFQSIQTLVYQALTTILYFIALFMYLSGLGAFIAVIGAIGQPSLSSSTGIFGMIVVGALLVVSFVLILSIPLLHILGQWAGYRVLKGENYRYPLIGRFVEKRILTDSMIEENVP